MSWLKIAEELGRRLHVECVAAHAGNWAELEIHRARWASLLAWMRLATSPDPADEEARQLLVESEGSPYRAMIAMVKDALATRQEDHPAAAGIPKVAFLAQNENNKELLAWLEVEAEKEQPC